MNVKRKIIIIAVILVSVLLLSAFSVDQLLNNVDMSDYSAQCQKIFNLARYQWQQIRNETLPDVTLHVITKQDAVNMWGKPSANADLTYILRQETVYKGLFLMTENDSLYQANVDWTANWAAATVGKTDIYVIKENFNPFDKDAEGTFVHELTHVWQPELPAATTFDEDKAHSGLIEGDAVFMNNLWTNLTVEAQASLSPMIASVDGVPEFLIGNQFLNQIHPIPQTVWDLDYFPYQYGPNFIGALYQTSGFASVNQAYQSGFIPVSSSQILHPAQYLANETPVRVSAPSLVDSSWTLTQEAQGQDHNTMGEFFIQEMLKNHVPQAEAQNASSGWRGDNFTYYERGNDFLFTWNIKWDSSSDASQFYVAFHDMAKAAGATDQNNNNWYANGRYLSISLDQSANSTLIACSTVQTATTASNLSFN
ncbi:MAG TPA: hypothetical protein VMD05_08865 [Candidatus Nanoarchaeia archaeon]|nr:hypothetical protein [Candidatus Nanoarchaeia archaeon]